MAGYYGYSMSNNAVQAYADGEKPLSKWTKKEILQRVAEVYGNELAEAVTSWTVKSLKRVFLEKTSWHHTSKFYNQTDFYSFNEGLEVSADEVFYNFSRNSRNIPAYALKFFQTTNEFYKNLKTSSMGRWEQPLTKEAQIDKCYAQKKCADNAPFINVLSKEDYFKRPYIEREKIYKQTEKEIFSYKIEKLFERLEKNFEKFNPNQKTKWALGWVKKIEFVNGSVSLYFSGVELLEKDKKGIFIRKYNNIQKLKQELRIRFWNNPEILKKLA